MTYLLSISTYLATFAIYTGIFTVILLIAKQFEKRIPVEAEQSRAAVIVDWKMAAIKIVMNKLLSPITMGCGIMVINAAGGGLIHLRSDGLWFLFSVVIVLVAIDFLSYLTHRALHKFPILWAMHSLHHSAEAMSMITGARHFWFEEIVTTPVFWGLAIIFEVPLEVLSLVSLLFLLLGDGLVHLNMRVSFGPFVLWLNNPQLHRIHHSVEPQHRDKNFCKMFPLFDVIFGTSWKPGKDEFPKTGLASSDTASGFLDGIIWPVRHRLPVRRKNWLLLQTGQNTLV
jgi:sterol desaturase/sphingolipid hydroxylase (fatty acid hydroxylase superfamily)